MKFLDILLGAPTLRTVTESLVKELRLRGEVDLAVNAADGVIDVRRDGKSSTVLNAHNLLHEVVRLPRAGRPAAIRRFLDGLLLTEAMDARHFAEVAPFLLPVVRSADDYGIHGLSAEVSRAGPMATVATRPLVNDIVVALVVDGKNAMATVAEKRLEEWGVSFEQALDQALSNLRGLAEHGGWKQVRPGVWSGEWGDYYESSRMLLPDLVHRLNVKNPVVMVPFRGAILVTSAQDGEGIEGMLATVEQSIANNNRWISFRPAILHGTAWTPFTPPPALEERFRRLSFESAAPAYAQQKELLEKKFEADGGDVFVASYSAFTRDERLVTWATWSEGVTHALLPVTDVVVFVMSGSDAAESLMVPWACVREIVGHLMLPTEWMPTRLQVQEFPSPEELERLKAAALPTLG